MNDDHNLGIERLLQYMTQPSKPDHVPDAQLLDLMLGLLPSEQAETLWEHIDSCPACSVRLGEAMEKYEQPLPAEVELRLPAFQARLTASLKDLADAQRFSRGGAPKLSLSFDPLVGFDRWSIHTERGDWTRSTSTSALEAQSTALRTDEDDEAQNVSLSISHGSIKLSVLDPNGNADRADLRLQVATSAGDPIVNELISLSDSSGKSINDRTGASGDVQFYELSPGLYVLTLESSAEVLLEVEVTE